MSGGSSCIRAPQWCLRVYPQRSFVSLEMARRQIIP